MEAGESGTRQSSVTSANSSHFGHRTRDSLDRTYRDRSNMATAALISPNTPYHPHHPPPFSSSGYHSGPNSAVPSMISPVEPRRSSDDHEQSHRQSLPSISEVIGQKAAYPPPVAPGSMSGTPSLPSPYSSSTPTRPFSEIGSDRHPSPRTLHSTSSFPRADPLPAFSDAARPPLSGRPPAPPPLTTFSGLHPPASGKADQPSQAPLLPPQQQQQQQHHEAEPRQAEPPQLNGGYGHPPGQHSHSIPPPYTPSGQLPPGQLPLSGYPISPRHGGPSLPSPFDPQRPPLHPDDPEFARRNKYEATLHRHFEAWSYAEYLARIGSTARTIFNFAEAYGSLAREEHGAHPIPSRLPSEREVAEMMTNADWLRSLLENVRGIVQHSMINERAREGHRPKGPYEDEDMPMYNDPMKASYGIPEVKKRRGRAAPPGRCHSCNRIDTPEWRRGPDGARTLCNACGLHYAKLERKKLSESRSLRPKPSEERT